MPSLHTQFAFWFFLCCRVTKDYLHIIDYYLLILNISSISAVWLLRQKKQKNKTQLRPFCQRGICSISKMPFASGPALATGRGRDAPALKSPLLDCRQSWVRAEERTVMGVLGGEKALPECDIGNGGRAGHILHGLQPVNGWFCHNLLFLTDFWRAKHFSIKNNFLYIFEFSFLYCYKYFVSFAEQQSRYI